MTLVELRFSEPAGLGITNFSTPVAWSFQGSLHLLGILASAASMAWATSNALAKVRSLVSSGLAHSHYTDHKNLLLYSYRLKMNFRQSERKVLTLKEHTLIVKITSKRGQSLYRFQK